MIKSKILLSSLTLITIINLTGCNNTQEEKDKKIVQSQQKQYSAAQPLPVYDWSLERENVIKLYNLRNEKVSTHTVWRSNYGMVEGDCPSLGYGIPYDTSLTNPLQTVSNYKDSAVIGQAEPNGIFASTNTAATWVMCVGTSGSIEPVYVESKVTTYPYQVKVNYKTNRVQKVGKTTAILK